MTIPAPDLPPLADADLDRIEKWAPQAVVRPDELFRLVAEVRRLRKERVGLVTVLESLCALQPPGGPELELRMMLAAEVLADLES